MLHKAFVIFFLLGLATAHPISRRQIGGPCSGDSWPDASTNCTISDQLWTPLSIKRMLVTTENALSKLENPSTLQCSDCFEPPQTYCASPSFALNPHLIMSDTLSHNIGSDPIVQQRLGWSFLDHYSSLLSFTETFSKLNTNTTLNISEDVPLLVNLSLSVQRFILPDLSSIQEKTINLSTITCSSSMEQVRCLKRQFRATLSSFREHIMAFLNLHYSLRVDVNSIPDCAIWASDPLTHQDFRRMVCSARKASFETYNLLDTMGSKAVTNCTGSSYISGVPSWLEYYELDQFPPTTPLNMFIYASYLKALQQHTKALDDFRSNAPGRCFTPVEQDKIVTIRSILTNTTRTFKAWVDSKPCECAQSNCTQLGPVMEVPTPLNTTLCLSNYQQLYCMAVDLRGLAESSYLFLNLLPEAEPTWSTPCSSLE